MIPCAISIPETNWTNWLEPIQNTQRISSVECIADCLTNQDFTDAITKKGLSCISAKDIIPPITAEFLANDATGTHFAELKNTIFNVMLCAESMNTTLFSLQLHLDRKYFSSTEEQIHANCSFIKSMLKAPLENAFSLALQVRQPLPFPKSREMEMAKSIISRLKSPKVGLYVHFYPDEYAENGTIQQFMDDNISTLKAICFHYDTRIGETLFDDEQLEWSQRLKDSNFHGQVIFAPAVSPDADLHEICQTILSWADFYSE